MKIKKCLVESSLGKVRPDKIETIWYKIEWGLA